MALGKGLNSLIPQKKISRRTKTEAAVITDGNRIWDIKITEVSPNSEQPRRDFAHKELEEMIISIKEHGVLQPIVVTEREGGGYELIAGERRLRASQMAGLKTVPAIVRAATKQEKLELALIENIQRQNLNPIEEALAFKRLVDEFNLTQGQVGQKVGKSRPVVANTIRLLDLPDVIQKSLIDGLISIGKARAILSLRDKKEQIAMYKAMLGDKTTVRDVEKAVEARGSASRKGCIRRDPNLIAQEELLQDRLGTRVKIFQKGERGTIVIDYYSKEELKRILEEML